MFNGKVGDSTAGDFFYPLKGAEHGSQPSLTTRDRDLVSVLEVIIEPGDRSMHVMVDGCRSKLVNIVSGVQQDSVLGPLLFLLYSSKLFHILENKLIGYAGDSTLIAVVPSSGVRVTIAESLNRALVNV